MMRGILAGIVTAAALTVAPAVASSPDYGPRHTQRMAVPVWQTRPCAEEDSVNCFWDARTRGNGHGHSFYVRMFPGRADMVCVTYVGRRFARHHDYCEATR